LGSSWQPKQVTIIFFDAIEITKQTLTNNLTKLFDQYGLRNKIIAYVKDEGSNLNTMIIIQNFVVKCEVLGLDEIFQGACFGHVFFKAYQYVTIDKKICKNFKFVSIEFVQSNLQKCIIWPKKSRKGRQESTKACLDSNLPPRKLNIPMKTR
jgi:hypothetical protein